MTVFLSFRDDDVWSFQRKVAAPMFHKRSLDEMMKEFLSTGDEVTPPSSPLLPLSPLTLFFSSSCRCLLYFVIM